MTKSNSTLLIIHWLAAYTPVGSLKATGLGSVALLLVNIDFSDNSVLWVISSNSRLATSLARCARSLGHSHDSHELELLRNKVSNQRHSSEVN